MTTLTPAGVRPTRLRWSASQSNRLLTKCGKTADWNAQSYPPAVAEPQYLKPEIEIQP